MNIPEFTAQASLYRTNNRYRSSGLESGDLWYSGSIVPTYYPGPAAKAACDKCLTSARDDYFKCVLLQGFPLSLIHCTLGAWWNAGSCVVEDCCPKRCEFSIEAGKGCCDADEHCVDPGDPNSRSGCCPSDQDVCAGKCCAKGEKCCGDLCCAKGHFCCGDTCCPSNMMCDNGSCTYPSFGGEAPPPPHVYPPIKPIDPSHPHCDPGWTPCMAGCCPPGLRCCGPVCAEVCVN